MSPADRLRAEIIDLHRFFVDWYCGTADPAESEAVLKRFRDDFHYVFPGGGVIDKAGLARMLARSHGENSGFRIWVEQFGCQELAGGFWRVTYKEFQSGARNSETINGRISSGVFSLQPDHAQWVHLQETWLPQAEVQTFHDDFGTLVYGLPPRPVDLSIVRDALRAETAAEAARQGVGNTLRMRLLCAQLFLNGDPADVPLIWAAKQSSFDAGCAIESGLLSGAGLFATRGWLAASALPEADAIAEALTDPGSLAESLVAFYRG